MSNFKPGDRCIIIPPPFPEATSDPRLEALVVWEIVTLTTFIGKPPWVTNRFDHFWVTDLVAQYGYIYVDECRLQKIPPDEQPISWDECLWKPEEVTNGIVKAEVS